MIKFEIDSKYVMVVNLPNSLGSDPWALFPTEVYQKTNVAATQCEIDLTLKVVNIKTIIVRWHV